MKEDKKYKYPIVAVLWNDPHIFLRTELPDEDLEDYIIPTLTVGLLYKQTDDYVVLVHTAERQFHLDEGDFTIIFNGCIISMKEFGTIKLTKLRPKGAS